MIIVRQAMTALQMIYLSDTFSTRQYNHLLLFFELFSITPIQKQWRTALLAELSDFYRKKTKRNTGSRSLISRLRHIRLHNIQQFLVHHKPVYLRVGRAGAAMLHDTEGAFEIPHGVAPAQFLEQRHQIG